MGLLKARAYEGQIPWEGYLMVYYYWLGLDDRISPSGSAIRYSGDP
jgi:hypothetical protein